MNSQPSSVSTRSIVLDGGGAHGSDHRGRAVEQRDALAVDTAEDLFPVDLPDDDLTYPHRRDRVGHAPPVAVEGRQRVQVDVAVGQTQMPAEGHGVEPAAA